jgi:hypothetical protein
VAVSAVEESSQKLDASTGAPYGGTLCHDVRFPPDFIVERADAHSPHNSNFAAARFAADLALQSRLGLLSHRRNWPSSSDRSPNRVDGAPRQNIIEALLCLGRGSRWQLGGTRRPFEHLSTPLCAALELCLRGGDCGHRREANPMSAPGLSALPPATVHKRQIPNRLRKAAVFERAPRGSARDSGRPGPWPECGRRQKGKSTRQSRQEGLAKPDPFHHVRPGEL